jgi:hypothetical protein
MSGNFLAPARGGPRAPSGRAVVAAVIGWAGLVACLTAVFLSMRAVLGVGGACADGGAYVIAQPCPDGVAAAMSLGIPAGLLFAAIASWGGGRIGGFWASTPILAWSGLFGSLGFNFLDAAWFSAPADAGVEIGGVVVGVMFEVMALVPLAGVLLVAGSSRATDGRGSGSSSSPSTRPEASTRRPMGDGSSSAGSDTVRDPITGQVLRLPPHDGRAGTTTVVRGPATVTTSSVVIDADDLDADLRAKLAELRAQLAESTDPGASERDRQALAGIAADFGAAIANAVAQAPVAPGARDADGPPPAAADEAPSMGEGADDDGAAGQPGFTEGTQALLDRLERLADMRDRGLLEPAEYETAKATIMAELEGRT